MHYEKGNDRKTVQDKRMLAISKKFPRRFFWAFSENNFNFTVWKNNFNFTVWKNNLLLHILTLFRRNILLKKY